MAALVHKLKTAATFSIQDWGMLFKGWLLLLYIRLRMDFTPFKSWKTWLINDTASTSTGLSANDRQIISQAHRMIMLAARMHIVNANCLPKSLALKWLLNRHHIDAELRIGLSVNKDECKGHAWLVKGELVLNDSSNIADEYPVKQVITHPPLIN